MFLKKTTNKTKNFLRIRSNLKNDLIHQIMLLAMQVVILAAGRGKRMGEYTESTTKAMLPIGKDQTPMLEKTVENCLVVGLNDFIFVVGYRKEDIIDHFSTQFYKKHCNVQFIEQTNVTDGTAKAVECAKPLLKEDKFILIYGDVVPTVQDVAGLVFIAERGLTVMGTREVENPSKYGVVEVNDKKEIQRIVEKSPNPPSNLINAGLYGFSDQSIFKFVEKVTVSARGEYELTDALQMFINSGRSIYIHPVKPQDIGTKDEYEKVKATVEVK